MKRAFAVIAVVAISASTMSSIAFAAWTSMGKVSDVYAGNSDGSVIVRGLSNTASCSNSDIIFLPSSSDPARVLTLATAAVLSDKNFLCSVSGCTSSGYQLGNHCRLVK